MVNRVINLIHINSIREFTDFGRSSFLYSKKKLVRGDHEVNRAVKVKCRNPIMHLTVVPVEVWLYELLCWTQ